MALDAVAAYVQDDQGRWCPLMTDGTLGPPVSWSPRLDLYLYAIDDVGDLVPVEVVQ